VDADVEVLVRCLDLTSLGDDDDEASVAALCRRALQPVPGHPDLVVAAVCVWPRFAPIAATSLAGSPVRVACATGGFPTTAQPLEVRLAEIAVALAAGADEVDVVVNRALVAQPAALAAELTATRGAVASARWKAILETGALDDAAIETLGRAAIAAGADFLKTSTGKGTPGASLEAVARLAGLIADAGRPVGLKVSGGVRTVAAARAFLACVRATLGEDWPGPARFRIGASGLLDRLVEPA
jgi:deoxyribose-phosphate aldolase